MRQMRQMRHMSEYRRHRGRMLKEDYEHIKPDFGAYLTKAFNDFILKEVIPPMKHALPNRNWKFKVMDDSNATNPLCKIIVAVGEGKSIPVVGVGWTDLTRKNGDTEQVNVLIWGNEGELIEFDFRTDDFMRKIELKPTEFVKLFRYVNKILSKETVRESRFHKGKVLREDADEYDFNPEAMEKLRDAYDFEVARRYGSDYAFEKARDYVIDEYGYEWYELPESRYEYEEATGHSIDETFHHRQSNIIKEGKDNLPTKFPSKKIHAFGAIVDKYHLNLCYTRGDDYAGYWQIYDHIKGDDYLFGELDEDTLLSMSPEEMKNFVKDAKKRRDEYEIELDTNTED